jgi:hypothetical protein
MAMTTPSSPKVVHAFAEQLRDPSATPARSAGAAIARNSAGRHRAELVVAPARAGRSCNAGRFDDDAVL